MAANNIELKLVEIIKLNLESRILKIPFLKNISSAIGKVKQVVNNAGRYHNSKTLTSELIGTLEKIELKRCCANTTEIPPRTLNKIK